MAAENIGALIPTKIPGYADAADIQAALRLYHYGSYDYDPANTSPASLVSPSIAYTLNSLQGEIDTLETNALQGTIFAAKGDLLSASANDTPLILSSGTSGQFLVVNTATATGLQWTNTLASPIVSGLTLSDSSIIFEGSVADDFETTLTVANPTADRTVTIPDATTTLVGTDVSQTLTNKTLTAPVISTISNTGTLTLPTSTDTLVGRATTDTLTNKSIALGSNTITGTIAQFNTALTDADFATIAGTETLTNKTLTSPTISNPTFTGQASGLEISFGQNIVFEGSTADANELTLSAGDPTLDRTITLPDATDTLVGRATTDTLTNKTISGSSNTLSNIGNSSLTNSSITINGSSVSLGGSITVSAASPNALTIGTGLSGTSYNGSTAVTIAIDSTVTTLTGSQTLTNKTFNLTSNTLTGTIAQFNTALSDADFATLAGTETLTNKTFTDSTTTFQDNLDNTKKMQFELSGISVSTTRTLTVPNVNGTIVTTGDSGTVTSTMIADGTIVNGDINASAAIAVSKLAASTISGVTLGSNLNALTIGTGLSGTSYNGSAAVTVAIDSTVATLTGSQTLTNKTFNLASNTLTGTTAQFNTALSDGDFATLAGTETLTNKTLTAPIINLSLNAQVGTSYTPVLADNGKLVTLSNASAITLTVPLNSSVSYATGAQINLLQLGAGQVTVAGAGGVTVYGTPGLKFRAQYSAATLIKLDTDTWLLTGDLSA